VLGPRRLANGLQEWNLEDGLLLFKGKIYVPNDPTLHRRIVQLHHESIASGHPWTMEDLRINTTRLLVAWNVRIRQEFT